MRRNGITLVETMFAVLVIAGAVLTFVDVIYKDMRSTNSTSWDSVAQAVGQGEMERLSMYLGNDGVDLDNDGNRTDDNNADGDCTDIGDECGVDRLPVCSATPSAAMIFDTHTNPSSPLASLPWARGLHCANDYGFSSQAFYGAASTGAKKVTVIVEVYDGPLNGSGQPPAGATLRKRKFVTVVAPGGIDKT